MQLDVSAGSKASAAGHRQPIRPSGLLRGFAKKMLRGGKDVGKDGVAVPITDVQRSILASLAANPEIHRNITSCHHVTKLSKKKKQETIGRSREFQKQAHVMLMQAQSILGEPCGSTATASVWQGYDRFNIELCEVDADWSAWFVWSFHLGTESLVSYDLGSISKLLWPEKSSRCIEIWDYLPARQLDRRCHSRSLALLVLNAVAEPLAQPHLSATFFIRCLDEVCFNRGASKTRRLNTGTRFQKVNYVKRSVTHKPWPMNAIYKYDTETF